MKQKCISKIDYEKIIELINKSKLQSGKEKKDTIIKLRFLCNRLSSTANQTAKNILCIIPELVESNLNEDFFENKIYELECCVGN